MEPVIVNGLDITRELLAEFERGWHFDALQAKLRQQAAAEERRRLGPARAVTGADDPRLGVVQFQIDPFWYHYWGKRESYAIFSDEKEMARFARDTPEIVVERERRAVVQGWDGEKREARSEKRGEVQLWDARGEALAG